MVLSIQYIVLSSVKLEISDFSTKKKISLINILNNSGPNREPCGIAQEISDHLLYEKPTLGLCFLKLRQSNRKLRLPRSNTYASNFAINKSCKKQSYSLDKSIKIVLA